MQKRIFSPREQNFLLKHNKKIEDVSDEMPVEYTVGVAEFYGREFFVDRNVLIPRIETEEIIDIAINEIRRREQSEGSSKYSLSNVEWQTLSILDLGTGSGCIGITLCIELQKLKSDRILTLSDISADALTVARKNVEKLIPQEHVSLITSNLCEDIPIGQTFDIITANLPYIPSSRMTDLDESVKAYEPLLALDGGETGADIINRFLAQLPERLNTHGFTILEIDDSHTLSSFDIPKSLHGEILQDSFGRNRFLMITRNFPSAS